MNISKSKIINRDFERNAGVKVHRRGTVAILKHDLFQMIITYNCQWKFRLDVLESINRMHLALKTEKYRVFCCTEQLEFPP